MYTIKVYAGDKHCNTLFVDDWKVVRDGSWNTATYLLMIRKPEFEGYRESLYICHNWGFKAFDENGRLVRAMGQVDGEWIQPHVARSSGNLSLHIDDNISLYVDEYADQPDAI